MSITLYLTILPVFEVLPMVDQVWSVSNKQRIGGECLQNIGTIQFYGKTQQV